MSRARSLLASAAAVLLVGCASPDDGASEQLEALEQRLTDLEGENDELRGQVAQLEEREADLLLDLEAEQEEDREAEPEAPEPQEPETERTFARTGELTVIWNFPHSEGGATSSCDGIMPNYRIDVYGAGQELVGTAEFGDAWMLTETNAVYEVVTCEVTYSIDLPNEDGEYAFVLTNPLEEQINMQRSSNQSAPYFVTVVTL